MFILHRGFIHSSSHCSSAIENVQLKPGMVDDRMINVQVVWNGHKITVEESPAYLYLQPQYCENCISTDIGKQSMV